MENEVITSGYASMLNQIDEFSNEFIEYMTDDGNSKEEKRQYLADKQSELSECNRVLDQAINKLKNIEKDTEENRNYLTTATALRSNIKEVVDKVVGENMITNPDNVVDPSDEFDDDINKSSSTFKRTLKEIQSAQTFTHCLICDGQLKMFEAHNKQEIAKAVNDIANAGTYDNIRLYEVQFKEVPLKIKVVKTISIL